MFILMILSQASTLYAFTPSIEGAEDLVGDKYYTAIWGAVPNPPS
jgi:hypothetical protein